MANKMLKMPVDTAPIERSMFKMDHSVKTTFKYGQVVPINIIECIANSSYKCDLSALIRMSTPIAPIMDNIWADIYAFFVPFRLLLKGDKPGDFESIFTGHNEETSWIAEQTIPDIVSIDPDGYDVDTSSLGHYMFLPVVDAQTVYDTDNFNISPLPGRAYYLIYNEFYRNERTQVPYDIDFSNDGKILSTDNYRGDAYNGDLLNANKRLDLFTSVLPSPLPGAQEVSIGLSGDVPVLTREATHSTTGYNVTNATIPDFGETASNFSYLAIAGSGSTTSLPDGIEPGMVFAGGASSVSSNRADFVPNNLYADLSSATSVTIDALRQAIALQHLLQNDARGGLRYFEVLNAHFGTAPADEVLQRPQVIGHTKIRININQVLNTAGYTNTAETTTGQTGAVSTTTANSKLFTYTATEPGYIIFMLTTHHDQTYSQGVAPMYYRLGRFDFYWREFAHLSNQALPTKWIDAIHAADDDVLGYQDYGDEYRFLPNRATGLLDPAASSSLNYWTLGTVFASKPVLNSDFTLENRNSISRALVTGDTGPDFICDFYFGGNMVLPMPTFGVPGLKVF